MARTKSVSDESLDREKLRRLLEVIEDEWSRLVEQNKNFKLIVNASAGGGSYNVQVQYTAVAEVLDK